ncbi:hypothetical protein KIW84_072075 [Lathyrus oleraceus]|uniref:Uncharacterized protein n=1 Tax=Pisum sativum TaxID=3888 RepID=A0A9D4VMB0_PEA|nr:hypothetical protein KIW84_072075 [Pisum sativum]
MSQPSVSTPNKRTKEQSNLMSVGTDVYLYEVITDVIPISMIPSHATSIRKPGNSASRKGKPSKSSKKSEEKVDSDGMSGDLSDKEENSGENKDQSIDIVNMNDLKSDDEPIVKILALGIAKRLFTGKHVPDIVMTSGQKPTSSTTKTGNLHELKDICKTLDETIKVNTKRKSRLEILIKALFKAVAEGNSEGDNADEEDTTSVNTSDVEERPSSDED